VTSTQTDDCAPDESYESEGGAVFDRRGTVLVVNHKTLIAGVLIGSVEQDSTRFNTIVRLREGGQVMLSGVKAEDVIDALVALDFID
jgi:hypothetical protein